MVVTMPAVMKMQTSIDQTVCMIAVRDGLMFAIAVAAFASSFLAIRRVLHADCYAALVNMRVVHRVQVAFVNEVRMISMLYLRVSTSTSVSVVVIFVS